MLNGKPREIAKTPFLFDAALEMPALKLDSSAFDDRAGTLTLGIYGPVDRSDHPVKYQIFKLSSFKRFLFHMKRTAALQPPIAPTKARAVKSFPVGSWMYEPKWDGFRCLIFRDGNNVFLQSRPGKSLTAAFPEIVAAVLDLNANHFGPRRRTGHPIAYRVLV